MQRKHVSERNERNVGQRTASETTSRRQDGVSALF